MKRFKFRLQTLLDQRLAHENELLRELSILRNEEINELSILRSLENRSTRAFDHLSEKLNSANINPQELSRIDDFARGTLDDIEVQKMTIEEVRKRIIGKRNEVIEAMKERKVLDTLKDKQETAHKLVEARAEQNQLDEMSSLRYARGM